MEHQNDEIEIDLMEILYVIRSKIVMIILTAMIFGIASGLFTHYMITPKYSSTSSIYVLTNESIVSMSDLQIGNSLTSDYIQMIQSRTVIETVIKNLEMEDELTYEGLRSCVSISNPSDTRILNLTVTYDDPRIAKAIVDELAKVSIERIYHIMDTPKAPNIFEKGYINTNPVSPNTKRNIIIAFFVGFILAVGIVIFVNIMDDTIHSPEDVEKYLKLNTLAAIPVSEDSEAQIRKDDIKRRGGKLSRMMGRRS